MKPQPVVRTNATPRHNRAGRLGHLAGPCGPRARCGRLACRRAFGIYRTVEIRLDLDGDLLETIHFCCRRRLRAWEVRRGDVVGLEAILAEVRRRV